MKKYKTIKTKRSVIKEVICDRCGELTEVNSPNELYKFNDFNLSYEKGSLDEYDGTEYLKIKWSVEDLCEKCIRFLEELLVKNDFKIDYEMKDDE